MSHRDSSQHVMTPSLDDICGNAMKQQVAGRLDQAERLYREILQVEPRHAAANYCVGMLIVQLRRPLDALPHLLAALEVNPELPDYWLGYLEALLLAGQIGDAAASLALGRQHGLSGAAVEEFAKRLAAHVPPSAAHVPPSAARERTVPPIAPPEPLAPLKKLARADVRRQQRLILERENALSAMLKQGRFAEGLDLARSLTERFPERALGWKTLGALHFAQRQADEAIAAMQKAIQAAPQDAEALKNLGTIFNKLDRLGEAEIALRRALEIDPEYAEAHSHLGNTYQLQGRYAEAEASFRMAISLPSDDLQDGADMRCSGLLFMLSHNPDIDADALFAEHCRIGEKFGAGAPASWPRHLNTPDPDRGLRIGFVSGDLCDHPIANFIEPIFANLRDCPSLELHAYSSNPTEDGVSNRLRGYLKDWHAVSNLSATRLAKKIITDRIDVLIDLSGHTSFNRLRTFARKPAPIQASWMGYPGTTGLRAMDYFLVDRHFLPPGQFDRYFTEKLVYLPALAPFEPHAAAPAVNSLPALANGHITFGSFNRLGKINARTVAAWSQLLLALPESKMLLAGLPPTGEQHPLIHEFAAHGILRERLLFHSRCGIDAYLALHHKVDLCLDTYPYNGGTTTMHALWMGVPTLTIAGSTPPARAGAAILGQVGIDGFAAANPSHFVERGLYWATHLEALACIREGLRARLQRSPGRQADTVAAAFERTLRHMWRRWCANLPPESFHSPAAPSAA
jgi:predicted O-linked N-acetylglucosamine transferase (SPINDLY family)